MNKLFLTTGLRYLWLVSIIIGIDILTKQKIMQNMYLHETKPLLNFLNLFYSHNYGIAFGFLSKQNSFYKWFIIIIISMIILYLLFIMYSNHCNQNINIAYAMIIGGALGNLFDRFYYGYVIDFIDFHINSWHFPTFNIADCSIFIGNLFVMIDSVFIVYHLKK
ncbi:MAG: signal peptidase II [Pantoea sp. Brub]|nr:signal peptidase II [Pantoea sp. Brub]